MKINMELIMDMFHRTPSAFYPIQGYQSTFFSWFELLLQGYQIKSDGQHFGQCGQLHCCISFAVCELLKVASSRHRHIRRWLEPNIFSHQESTQYSSLAEEAIRTGKIFRFHCNVVDLQPILNTLSSNLAIFQEFLVFIQRQNQVIYFQ